LRSATQKTLGASILGRGTTITIWATERKRGVKGASAYRNSMDAKCKKREARKAGEEKRGKAKRYLKSGGMGVLVAGERGLVGVNERRLIKPASRRGDRYQDPLRTNSKGLTVPCLK